MDAPNMGKAEDRAAQMRDVLARQKAAHVKAGAPSAEVRIERLNRCIRILHENSDALAEALNADFGNRSREVSGFTDVASSIGPLRHARDHLKTWMKTEKRKPTPAILACSARRPNPVSAKGRDRDHQPLELPGEPYLLAPRRVLAAGNRAMIKPSEFTPATSS